MVVSGSKKSKRARASKKANNSRKKQKIEDNPSDLSSFSDALGSKAKSTLIVCPPSVFSSWVKQLGEHTVPGKLKVYMYYGERTNDADELKKYDIVLTTYSILANEDS